MMKIIANGLAALVIVWLLGWNSPANAATVTITVVGDPATQPWGADATIAETRDVMADVYFDGVLHHTEHDPPYNTALEQRGTGTHTVQFIFWLEGTATEVGRQSLTVTEGAAQAPGVSAMLNWNANVTDADLAGYKIYQSTTPGVYGAPIATVGTVTTYTTKLPTLATAMTYYFSVSAYDVAGNESLTKSNEASKIVPGTVPPVTGTVTFAPVTGFVFTGLIGSTSSASVTVTNGMNVVQTLTYTAPFNWLTTTTPLIMTIQPGAVATISMTANFTGQAAGVLTAVGTLTGGPTPLTIPIKATVTPIDVPPLPPQNLTVTQADLNGDGQQEVIVTALKSKCTSISTSTSGSNSTTVKRTLTCVK